MGGGGVAGGASGAMTAGAGRSRVMSNTSAGSRASAPTTYGGSGSVSVFPPPPLLPRQIQQLEPHDGVKTGWAGCCTRSRCLTRARV
jgi:hypothetical protein